MNSPEIGNGEGVSLKPRVEHSLSVKELFFKYVRFLPLYILCIALALLGAYTYLRYATEYYRSSGQIIIRDEKSAGSMNDRLEAAMQSDNRKNIQTEIAVLQSRPLMERSVNALGLNYNYYSKGKIKELDIYKVSPFRLKAVSHTDSTQPFTIELGFTGAGRFSVNGAGSYAFGDPFQIPAGTFRLLRDNKEALPTGAKVEYLPTSVQAGTLLGGLAVAPNATSGIVSVVMESTNPHRSADVVNALLREYQKVTIEDKNASTQKSLDFMDTYLRQRSLELDSINRRLVAYQRANNLVAPEAQTTNYLSRMEVAREQEQAQRLQYNNALQLQRYLATSNNDPVPSSLGIDDPTLNSLLAAYNLAQAERRRLLESAKEAHPLVQEKGEEIGALRGRILENLRNIRTSYSQTLGTLQSSSGEAVAQVRTMPTKTQELLEIQNQLEGKLKLYNEMLAKRDLTAITLASTISNTKVMQEALPNTVPVKPNRRTTQALALFIGLLVPTLVIVVMEILNDKVSSRADIERYTDATILGEVGHSFDRKSLVVTAGNRRVIAEQFRILRSNLQYVLTKANRPVIMVTSSFSGEGKSFVSTNTGAVMALANKRTIILEFDIRKPKVVSGLGLPKQRGLTNYILGEAKLEELPVRVPGYDNLFVLPCGPVPPNPAELLLDSKLDELFAYLRQEFEVVIMDTAPVGMVSDALALSKYADCTLYIVRQGHTYKKQIGLVDQFYTNDKLPRVSIVLNDVKIRAGYGGYGYGGNYGYGYGSGYFDDEPQHQTRWQRWFGWLGNGATKTRKTKNA